MLVKGNVNYDFNANNKPIVKCQSDCDLTFDCLDCFAGKVVEEKPLDFSFGGYSNPATGPVFIEGAEPGDSLKVEIVDIRVQDWGVLATIAGCGVLSDQSLPRTKILKIENDEVQFQGYRFQINPMIGVIGTAPKENPILCEDSFHLGGNMDCPLITKGSIVYLPIEVEGGLLSMGDLHALMGEGEIIGTGIEIAGEVDVHVSVVKEKTLHWPLLETNDSYYVLTNGLTCDIAIERGLKELRRLVCENLEMDETDAAMLLSLVGKVGGNQTCMSKSIQKESEGPTFRVGMPKLKKII